MKIRVLFVFVLLLVAALPIFAQDDNPTVLTVNGEDISAETFGERTLFEFGLTEQLALFRLQALERQATQYGVNVMQIAQQDPQFQSWLEELQDPSVLGLRVLDTLTNETLLQLYATENGIEVTEDDTLQAEYDFFGYDPDGVTEEQTTLYNEFVENFVNSILETGASEESLNGFFAQQALAAKVREQVAERDEFLFSDAAHILVDTEQEANAILALINDGEDFAQLAIERSLDSGSGAQGGALGNSPVLYYVTPFAQAIRDNEVGSLVGPVETQFGFHIIRIDDKTMQEVDEQTQGQLEGLLFQQWVLELTETAEVDIADNWAELVVVPEDDEPIAAEVTPELDAESTEEASD